MTDDTGEAAREYSEHMEAARDAELEDVLAYIRQTAIDATRFGAPAEVERALNSLSEDLRMEHHR